MTPTGKTQTRDHNLLREADKVRGVLALAAALFLFSSPPEQVPQAHLAWAALALAAGSMLLGRLLVDWQRRTQGRTLAVTAAVFLLGDLAWLMLFAAGTGGSSSPFRGLLLIAILFAAFFFASLPLALPLVTATVLAWLTGAALVAGLDAAGAWRLAGELITAVAVGWLGYALSAVLERERQANEQLVHLFTEGVMLLNAQGEILLANPRVGQLLGRPEEELAGRQVTELAVEPGGEGLAEALALVLGEGARQGAHSHLVEVTSQEQQTLRVVITPCRVTAGEPPGWMVVVEDVTELHAAARRTEEGLAMVSHELRSPLSAVRGLAQVLDILGPDMDDRQRVDTVRAIAGESKRLTQVVHSILDATQMEQGGYALECESVSVSALLHSAVESLRLRAAGTKVEVLLQIQGQRAELWADPLRLELVLRNLGENALRHTPPGGTVTLRAAQEGEQIVLEVSDTGPGIAPEDEQTIFEKWTRGAQEPTGRGQGLGLGLYMARQIVQQHGGTLTVSSPPGQGATFRVCLPAGEVAARHQAA